MKKEKIRRLIRRLERLQGMPESTRDKYNQAIHFHGYLSDGSDVICQSVACLAGHAVIMDRGGMLTIDDVRPSRRRIARDRGIVSSDDMDFVFEREAQDILGLTREQADRLFDPGSRDYGLPGKPDLDQGIHALKSLLENPDDYPWGDYFEDMGLDRDGSGWTASDFDDL